MSSEITIVIPSYNHENYVAQVLQSAAAINSVARPHLFLVDDGSTDRTFEIAQDTANKLSSSFASIHLEKRTNSGLSSSLNFALERIKTKYMLMIASDDLFCANIIEDLLPCFSQNSNVALVVGDNIFIDGSTRQFKRVNDAGREFERFIDSFTADKTGFTQDQLGKYQSFLTGNYIPAGWLIDVEKLKSIGGWNKTFILEDWELLCRLSRHFEIAVIDTVTAQYRIHGSNTSSMRTIELLFDAIRIFINEYQPARDRGFLKEWTIGVRHFRNLLLLKPEFARLFFSRIRDYRDEIGCVALLSTMTRRFDNLTKARDIESDLYKLKLQLLSDKIDRSRGCSMAQALASLPEALPEFLKIEGQRTELNDERKRALSIIRRWLYSDRQFYRLFADQLCKFDAHPQQASYIRSLAGMPSFLPMGWTALRFRTVVMSVLSRVKNKMLRLLPRGLKRFLRSGLNSVLRACSLCFANYRTTKRAH